MSMSDGTFVIVLMQISSRFQILGEQIAWSSFVGGVIIFTGVWLVIRK